MSRSHIVVVDPGVRRAETECFSALALRAPLPLTYVLPAMNGPDALAGETAARGLRGIVVLGSATSVHDAPPWQSELSRWLLAAASNGIPTLAICYGHQLVAHALGGKVLFRRDDHEKRIGLHAVTFGKTRLFDAAKTEGKLYFSHREIVDTAPAELLPTATGTEAGVEAMEHRQWPLWTVQAHPEATADFAARSGAPAGEQELAFGTALVDQFFKKIGK